MDISTRDTELLFPLLTFGSGRSGSTLLMQLLGSDTRCVFPRSHSFEERYLSHILQFSCQFDGRDLADVMQSPQLKAGMGAFPATIPSSDNSFSTVRSKDVFTDLWRRISSDVKQRCPEARFYAEKLPLSSMLWAVPIPHHTIFHFRDPRDIFLSANAFMAKKNIVGFGKQHCESDVDFAFSIAAGIAEEFANYSAMSNAESSALASCARIRYEDLVLEPEKTLMPVMEQTGMSISPTLPDEPYHSHRTTASVNQSIYRWKSEPIPQEAIECFSSMIPQELEALGYEVPPLASAQPYSLEFLQNSELPSSVRLDGADVADRTRDGWILESDDLRFSLTVDVQLNAELVHEIWLCTSGSDFEYLQLGWGADSGASRVSDTHTLIAQGGNHFRVNRFCLKGHPAWKGRIGQLQVRFVRNPKADGTVDVARQVLKWLRFTELESSSHVTQMQEEQPVVALSQDELYKAFRQQQAEIRDLKQDLAQARTSGIEQTAAIRLLTAELDKTVALVQRLETHAGHLEREREYFRARWAKIAKFKPVKNLLELRAYLFGKKPPIYD